MAAFSWDSMGSRWSVSIDEPISATALQALRDEVTERSELFDRTFSRFRRDSLVWRLASSAGVQEVPAELTEMLRLYLELGDATSGRLNPLIGFTIADLGYDDAYSLVPRETVRPTPPLGSLRLVDRTHLILDEPALIDLGALGKGFFVDRIGEMLSKRGIARFLVDGSGDVLYRGAEPLIAGLEDPEDPSRAIGVARLSGGSLCASGVNRRRWGALHHLVDADTSLPAQGMLATWVIAKQAALADGLATSLFLAEPEALRARFDFEYCVMHEDHTVSVSRGFPAELF